MSFLLQQTGTTILGREISWDTDFLQQGKESTPQAKGIPSKGIVSELYLEFSSLLILLLWGSFSIGSYENEILAFSAVKGRTTPQHYPSVNEHWWSMRLHSFQNALTIQSPPNKSNHKSIKSPPNKSNHKTLLRPKRLQNLNSSEKKMMLILWKERIRQLDISSC